MTAITTRQQAGAPHVALPTAAVQLLWFGAGAVLAFAVPYVFSSVFDWQHDWFLVAYYATMGAFIAAYIRATHADVVGLVRQGWKLSLAVGVLAAAFTVFSVLGKDATPRPGGAYFGFELLWWGAGYGAMDAIVLTAFPALVVYSLLDGTVHGWTRRVGFAAAALALMWAITATYHLGYDQYREDGLANPEIGNTALTVPALVSVSPVGSVIAHATMHVTAVTHAYETDIFLPPQTEAK